MCDHARPTDGRCCSGQPRRFRRTQRSRRCSQVPAAVGRAEMQWRSPLQNRRSVRPRPQNFSSPLEPFYGCDGCQAIAHTLLIEQARARVCGVIFQRCELRTQPVPPVFSRPKQASTDALIPVPAGNRDLSDMAIDHFSVHWIRRLFEAGIYESNDLAAEFCDEGHNLAARVRRMLPTLSVARRYRLNCGCRIAFRIKFGMIFSTFEKRAGDSFSIFWNSGTDLNCRLVTGDPRVWSMNVQLCSSPSLCHRSPMGRGQPTQGSLGMLRTGGQLHSLAARTARRQVSPPLA